MQWNNKGLVPVFPVLLLAALACGRGATVVPSAPAGLPAGQSVRTLQHGGRARSYILYLPASLERSRAVPLVLVFHGGTGNAESAVRMSGFNAVADKNGFIAVYPDGTGPLSDNKLLTWNGGACCGYAQENNVDDVGFVRAIVQDLQASLAVDPKRIYAAGMSNGGILSHRLACEAADLFAAVAPVAGTLNFSPCRPSQPVSIIEFHGTDDEHILYEGGYGPKSLVKVDFTSVQESVAFWVSADGCSAQPQTGSSDSIQHEAWSGCAGSTAVELYTVVGGGHAWPGGQAGWPDSDQPVANVNATDLIWRFFAAHPKA